MIASSMPEEFILDGLKITQVPARSSDGMEKSSSTQQEKHTTLATETEEEFAVIEESKEYKLSIMRRKRDPIPINNQPSNNMSMNLKDFGQFPRFEKSFRVKDEEDKIDEVDQEDSQSVVEIKPRVSENHLRAKFMQKLSLNRMIDPTGQNRPKSHQNLVIWDWDDTLNASTFLQPYQSQILKPTIRKKLPKLVQQQLDELEDMVIELLRKSAAHGPTYIITNAGHGWVELSSARFMPKLFKEIIMNSKKNGVFIISARAMFERQMPNAFKEWKFKTFHQLVEKMDKEVLTNIVAIGDSQIEIDAANSLQLQIIMSQQVYRMFRESCVKTVKLKEQPNIVELMKQVELILNQFEDICCCAKNLTIRLQKVQEEEQQQAQ